MSTDEGAVDHLDVDHLDLAGTCPAVIERIHNQLPQACQRPAPELPVNR